MIHRAESRLGSVSLVLGASVEETDARRDEAIRARRVPGPPHRLWWMRVGRVVDRFSSGISKGRSGREVRVGSRALESPGSFLTACGFVSLPHPMSRRCRILAPRNRVRAPCLETKESTERAGAAGENTGPEGGCRATGGPPSGRWTLGASSPLLPGCLASRLDRPACRWTVRWVGGPGRRKASTVPPPRTISRSGVLHHRGRAVAGREGWPRTARTSQGARGRTGWVGWVPAGP